MRDVPAEFESLSTLCYVWRLTLKDQTVLGFTDHDRQLVFDGLTCEPASGFTRGDTDSRLGFAAETGSVEGILQSPLLLENDLRNGRFEDALIEAFRVNWEYPSEFCDLARGYVGAIRQRGEVFEAELRGEASRLERSTGRVFSRQCDASFGDTRCGVDASTYPPGTDCPRTFAACRDQFSNTINFRGFPYLIGDDAMIAAPHAGETHDGGSRHGN